MRFLYWNINKKQISNQVSRLVEIHNPDVLVLLECLINPADILIALHAASGIAFHYIPAKTRHSCIFSKRNETFMYQVKGISVSNRFDIHRIEGITSSGILMVSIHAPSKWTSDPDDQGLFYDTLRKAIRRAETKADTRNVLLVGDLNVNPFEKPLVSIRGLNSVMSKKIALSKPKLVQGKRYKFFYNPMWNLLGDETPGPPGTYYHHTAKSYQIHWHMLDQVLLGPPLISRFSNKSLVILDKVGNFDLLVNGRLPKRKDRSDHLPIMFELVL